MKVALVHDYLKVSGGAERVFKVFTEMYPNAPIYTSFFVEGSRGYEPYKNKKVVESSFAPLIKYFNLYSPLRFLLPWIWGSMDLSKYDLVITSSSNYIARGFNVGEKTKVICYCHTPPRSLYGYKTGDLEKIWPVKIYAMLVAHFLRFFDFESAQKINYWIANSKNVQARIEKFYRKDSTVIYPPVDVKKIIEATRGVKKEEYFLIVSRLVGTKGLSQAVEASRQLKFKLKIVGEAYGLLDISDDLKKNAGENVEFLGHVEDKKLWKLYAEAKGFIALARDEDFGMTPVEAQAAGTPVIAFNGGGFRESVIDGKTGILIDDTNVATLKKAISRFNKINWDRKVLLTNAKRFSREVFEKKFKLFVKKCEQESDKKRSSK